jgi:hypothetical protein
MYVYSYYTYVYTYIHTYIHHTYTHTHRDTHAHTHTHTHTHAHTHIPGKRVRQIGGREVTHDTSPANRERTHIYWGGNIYLIYSRERTYISGKTNLVSHRYLVSQRPQISRTCISYIVGREHISENTNLISHRYLVRITFGKLERIHGI